MLFKQWEGIISEGEYEDIHIGRNQNGNIFIKNNETYIELLEAHKNTDRTEIHKVNGIVYLTKEGELEIFPKNLNTEFILGLIKKVFEAEGREDMYKLKHMETKDEEKKGKKVETKKGEEQKDSSANLNVVQWYGDLKLLANALNIKGARVGVEKKNGIEIGRICFANPECNKKIVKRFFRRDENNENVFIELDESGKEIGKFAKTILDDIIDISGKTQGNSTNSDSTGEGR